VRPAKRKTATERATAFVKAHPVAVAAGATAAVGAGAVAVAATRGRIYFPDWEQLGVRTSLWGDLTSAQRSAITSHPTSALTYVGDAVPSRSILAGVRAGLSDFRRGARHLFDAFVEDMVLTPMVYRPSDMAATSAIGDGLHHVFVNLGHASDMPDFSVPRWWDMLGGAEAVDRTSTVLRIIRERQLSGFAAESVYWRNVLLHEASHYVDRVHRVIVGGQECDCPSC
jgi:hypothetical protein